jgi:hypothetical protein
MEKVSININKVDYIKSLIPSVKLFIKFEDIPLKEEIGGQIMQSSGDQYSFIENSIYGKGLRMRPKSSLFHPLLLAKSTEFSLGFWLRPFWISPTINPITNLPVYYRMSLVDKSNYSYNNSNGFITCSNGTFSVCEESRDDGFNVMKILLCSSEGEQIIVETESYESGKFHHFWICYYGSSRKLDVFIDGKPSSLFSEDGLPIPKNLNNNSSVYFHINQSAFGYSSLLRNNAGLLDEVLFLNQFISDTRSISKIINQGVESLIDQGLFYKNIVNNCFAFDDPTSLGVTSVLGNGKNIYAGRSDGALFKGDRTMWQVRRDFANHEEINFIKKNVFDSNGKIEIKDGSLEIFKASARI